MRKALVPAFLLVLGAVVLGATVFREQLVHAATTPFQQVLVENTSTDPVQVQQVGTSTATVSGTVGIDPSHNAVSGTVGINNTSTNPVQVQQVGTSTATVSGTVGIDPSNNTVKLDPNNNTVSLGVTPVTELCPGGNDVGGYWSIGSGKDKTLCVTSGSWDVSTIVAQGMDDDVILNFYDGGNVVLELDGGGADGTSVYQLDLPRPLRVTEVVAICQNLFTNCGFTLNVLGTNNS